MDKTVIGDYNSFVNVGDAYGKDAGFVDELVSEISATSQELTATIEGIMRTIEDVSQAMTQGATLERRMSHLRLPRLRRLQKRLRHILQTVRKKHRS